MVRASFAEANAIIQRDASIESEKKAVDNETKATNEANRAGAAEDVARKERDSAKKNEEKALKSEEIARSERDNARAAREELRKFFYASQMNLVQNAWDAHNVELITSILKPLAVVPGDNDLLGFEWHYWNRLANAELQSVKLLEAGGVFSFSADGSRVAGLCKEGEPIRVWESTTGKELFARAGNGLALSPDGKHIAIVSCRAQPGMEENDVEVWEIATKTKTFQTRTPGVKGPAILRAAPFLAFDPGAKLLALAGRLDKSAELQVWDLSAKKEIFSRKVPGGVFYQPAFSSDGKLAAPLDLLKSPATRRVHVWNVAENKDLLVVDNLKLVQSVGGALKRHLGPNNCWAFSPDGKRLATGEWGEDEKIKVWNTANGQLLFSFSEPSSKPSALAFSPDGARLAVLGHGKIVTVWDLPTGNDKVLRSPTLALKRSPIPDREASSLAFSADGRRLCTAEINGAVKIWDTQPGRAFTLASRLAKKGKLPLRHLSSDGAYLCTAVGPGGGVGEMDIWDAKGSQTGRVPFSVPESSESFFGLVAFHPGGRFVSTAMPEGLTVWERVTGTAKFTIPAEPDVTHASVSFTADGKRLVLLFAQPSRVRFFDAETGQGLAIVPVGRRSEKLAMSRDGMRICLVEQEDEVKPAVKEEIVEEVRFALKAWDLASPKGTVKSRTIFVSPARVKHTAFSPDGRWLAAALGGSTTIGPWGLRTHMEVKVWNADTGKERFTLKTPSGHLFDALAFSPDSRRLATAENDQNGPAHVVKLWDISTGAAVLTLYPSGRVTKLAFSADGHRLSGLLLNPSPHGDLVQVWDATPPGR